LFIANVVLIFARSAVLTLWLTRKAVSDYLTCPSFFRAIRISFSHASSFSFPVQFYLPAALICPACLQDTTSMQRVLPIPLLNKLNNAQVVLDNIVARGGAPVRAYDYNCKLWRLPTAADAVKRNSDDAQINGASGSVQEQQQHQERCMPKKTSSLVSAVVAAAGTVPVPPASFYNGIVPRTIGAPVLQNDIHTTTTAAPVIITAALIDNARYQGIESLSLQLLGRPSDQITPDQRTVIESVFRKFVQNEFQFNSQLLNQGNLHLTGRLANMTMQHVNTLRNLYSNSTANGIIGNVANGNGITMQQQPQQQLLANGNGSADGAGPSTAVAAAPAAAPNLVRLPTRPVTTIPGCIDLVNWHKNLPPEDYRIASNRPDGVQNYIWTPHVSDFSPSSPRRHETVQRFVQRWAAGEPIIIRGMRGRVNWGPTVAMRAARDVKQGLKDIDVTDCSEWGAELKISAESFFRKYTACHGPTHDTSNLELPMYKLKDFPPEDTFVNRCKRHNDDFLQMLNECMPEYMHPHGGVLNLASKLPLTAVPPDLGPKGYIAFGREKEHEGIEGDSVTRLHEDLSDAINILCHVQHPPGTKEPPKARCGNAPMNNAPSFGGAGAVWDLYRREDIPVLRQFILDVVAEKVNAVVPTSGSGNSGGKKPGLCPNFYYKGKKLTLEDIKDPVHDQSIMLTAAHRAAAALPPYNLHSWLIEQYEYEGVVIPAACAHQVRNLRSCIKIALDFVSPESVPHCLAQREERRVLAMQEVKERGQKYDASEVIEERHFHDKLQVVNMVVHGLSEALDVLEMDEQAIDKEKESTRGRKTRS
jgi:hypothetical protein